jgi:beta-lactam-binding protein with PASTA domain
MVVTGALGVVVFVVVGAVGALGIALLFSAAKVLTPTLKKNKQAKAKVEGRIKNVMAVFLLNA